MSVRLTADEERNPSAAKCPCQKRFHMMLVVSITGEILGAGKADGILTP